MFREHQRLGPYTLVRRLGEGSYGVVWLAERRAELATTRLAIKCPTAAVPDLEDLRREAEVWVQVAGHPHILNLFEVSRYDGHVAFVSEYAEGGDLRAWLAGRGGRLAGGLEFLEIAGAILSGLQHLHERGVVHRDLKPANILLQAGAPKLGDFGISRVLALSTATMSPGGTPAYTAPEAWEGARSARTDLWSAGVILHEMLAGRRPFHGRSIAEIRHAIRHAEPDPLPPDTPRALADLVARALSKDPKDRHDSAGSMLADLRHACLAERFAATPPKAPAPEAPTPLLPTPPPTAAIGPELLRACIGVGAAAALLGGFLGPGAATRWRDPAAAAAPLWAAGDPVLASVEAASEGPLLVLTLGLYFALLGITLRKLIVRRRRRTLASKLFNLAENSRELASTMGWIVAGGPAAMAAYLAMKAAVLALALPACLAGGLPDSPRGGAFLFGASFGLMGAVAGALVYRWRDPCGRAFDAIRRLCA